MIVVCADEKNIVFLEMDKIRNINIHSNNKKIMASFFEPSSPDMILAEYDSPKKCERAFGLLMSAFESEEDFFRMPKNEDESLNTQLFKNGKGKKMHYETVGKTK